VNVQPIIQSGIAPAACKMEARTSFADTLKAAAQLELKSPGLLAKLALSEPNVPNLLGVLAALNSPAPMVTEQTLSTQKQLIELGVVDVKVANSQAEVCMMDSQTRGLVVGDTVQMAAPVVDDTLFINSWRDQAIQNGRFATTTLDDVSSVLQL